MELTSMKNIGTEMQRKLNYIGINNAEDLRRMGSKETYFRMKSAYPEICLVHLYAIQGAIDNVEYNMLPEDIKQELKAFSDTMK